MSARDTEFVRILRIWDGDPTQIILYINIFLSLGQARIRPSGHIIEEFSSIKASKNSNNAHNTFPRPREPLREIRGIHSVQGQLQGLDDEDYVTRIFSSWLGPLVSGKVIQGTMAGYGSMEGHIYKQQ
jgi:hypothetical protein